MHSSRFDAVLFDFSGVMVGSAFEALARLGVDGDRERTLELLLGPYHEDTDHPWHRVERGEMAIDGWVAEVSATAASEGIEIYWSVMGDLLGELEPYPQMEAEARRLRTEGYRVGLVTNNVREGSAVWRALLPVDELFEVVVDSCEVGLRKPDPRIFRLALDRLGGVEPGRCVFLDDAPGIVAGAEAAGLHAILVGDPDAAIDELRDLLSS